MARFWYKSNQARALLQSTLSRIDTGHLLSQKEKALFGVDFKTPVHGEDFFLANPGYEIFPNYWAAYLPAVIQDALRPSRGAHGYNPADPFEKGIFYYSGPSVDQLKLAIGANQLRVTDILPLILGLFEIQAPPQYMGPVKFSFLDAK